MSRYVVLLALLALSLAYAPARAAELSEAYVNLFKIQLSLAEKGGAAEKYGLAQMYEQGLGTEPDMEKATIWYAKAAEQGDVRAKKKLKDLERAKQEAAKAAKRAAEEAGRRAKVEATAKAKKAAEAKAAAKAKKQAEKEARLSAKKAKRNKEEIAKRRKAAAAALANQKKQSEDPFE